MHNAVLLIDRSNAHAHQAISEIQLSNVHLELVHVRETHADPTQDAEM